jgi:hypothetical protein
MQDWRLGTVRVNLVPGYDRQVPSKQYEVWFPNVDQAELARLVQSIGAATSEERRPALQVLEQKYQASTDAIGAVLAQLGNTGSSALGQAGRFNALHFLSRTSPLAWTQAQATTGQNVVAEIAKDAPGTDTRGVIDEIRGVLADVPRSNS